MFKVILFIISTLFVPSLGLTDVGTDVISNGGFFEMIFDRFEQIEANKTLADYSGLKVRKISKTNKTRAIYGDIYSLVLAGNNIDLEVKGFKKQGGEYRLMPYRVQRTPLCTFFIEDIYFYKDLAAVSDFPDDIKNNCPLKIGKYSFRGYVPNFEPLPKVILPTGDYIVETNLYIGDDLILKLHAFFIVNNIGN